MWTCGQTATANFRRSVTSQRTDVPSQGEISACYVLLERTDATACSNRCQFFGAKTCQSVFRLFSSVLLTNDLRPAAFEVSAQSNHFGARDSLSAPSDKALVEFLLYPHVVVSSVLRLEAQDFFNFGSARAVCVSRVIQRAAFSSGTMSGRLSASASRALTEA